MNKEHASQSMGDAPTRHDAVFHTRCSSYRHYAIGKGLRGSRRHLFETRLDRSGKDARITRVARARDWRCICQSGFAEGRGRVGRKVNARLRSRQRTMCDVPTP